MESATSRIAGNLKRFRPVLLTLAESLISPSFRGQLDASDLVQQTLMEAHHHAEQLATIDEGPFFSWLRKALQNNVLDAVKHLQTQKRDVRMQVRAADLEDSFLRLDQMLAADDTSPSQVFQRNEQIAIMLAALQELSDNQRAAIIMKHLQGNSLKEVADALGLSESATAGLLHRGRQQLVKRMENQGGV